jgi:phage/plasmid-associated DNA primase
MDGCLLLQQEGLEQPPIVQEATGEYRSDLDPLNDWITDNTITLPAAWTAFKDLYTDYKSWAEENGVQGILGSKTFSQRLGARFETGRTGKMMTRGFRGVGLKTGYQLEADTSEESAIGEVPVTSMFNSSSHVTEYQIGQTLPEVSASEVPAALDPWDEGWQDPAEPQS